ncbi:MAG TPA: YihY/virulence factor BrkB family protein [Gammaproteobacteria bacterium]|nr:YihY/virulence factor BrkB family protein [Gammaproteobacteria bacterium]
MEPPERRSHSTADRPTTRTRANLGTQRRAPPARDGSAERHQPRDARDDASTPPAGWKATLKHVWRKLSEDHVSLIAAGVSHYALLATFPALIAVVAVYGLVMSPERIQAQVSTLSRFTPPDVANIIDTALRSIADSQGGTLSFGAVLGVLLALWGARAGMDAVMTATNIAYGIDKDRSFLRRMLVSVALTVAAMLGFVLMLGVAVAIPFIARALGVGGVLTTVIDAVRWVACWLLVVLGLAVVYRFAPNREQAHWRWISYGSATAATVWVLASVLFSIYVQNFGSYGKTYGALGGVVVMLLWFYISSYVLLIGAEIDAALEKQTVPELRGRGPARGDALGSKSERPTVH